MPSRPFMILAVATALALALPAGATAVVNQEEAEESRFLTGPNEGDPEDIAVSYMQSEAATYGLSASDVADLVVRSSYTSRHNGVTHVNLNQRFEGLEVFGADTTVNIAEDGSVVFVGGNSVRGLRAALNATADLDAAEAVEAAADALDLDEPENLRVLRRAADETVLTDGGISEEPIPARLGWQPTADGLRLAWQVVIDDVSDVHLWNATVDASTGELLDVDDWTSDNALDDIVARVGRTDAESAAAAALAALTPAASDPVVTPNPVDDGSSYRVYQLPKETPNDGDRTLVENPADAEASPFGWHDVSGTPEPDFTTTRGNNVHAYLDQDANNQPDPGFDVDGGPSLTFDFPIDLNEHPQNYRDAAVANLFYWCNVTHDVFWHYGFDEPSGNFQVNNYGRGGVGGDDVRCEAMDGAGTNNANFSTPAADGGRPRMQMFLWPGNQFGFQNQVVVDGLGEFNARWARFSLAPTSAGQAGEIVYAGNGCTAAQYPAALPAGDWVAIVDGGTGAGLCTNPTRGQVAQAQGAEGLIVAHNTGAAAPILTGLITEPIVEIPVASITQADGNAIKAAVAVGTTTGVLRKHPNHPAMRAGDLEAGVILHEYSHGISNRLTGGPGINCLPTNFQGQQTQQMGEGWSDYHGIATVMDLNLDDPEEPRGMGPYILFQDSRQGPGIRPRPYSRNMEIQPATFDSIKVGAWLNGGSVSAPHGIGHIWAAILWDMTWDLVEKHGFNPDVYGDWSTGGNNLAQQLVIDGLKFQGCFPGFIQGRDAILAADEVLTEGENACTLWASFSRRGLGYSAEGTFFRASAQEAFDTHPDCRAGFSPPVSAGSEELNRVAAGSTVPLRFNLGSNRGLDILASNSPFSRRVDCDTLAVPSENPPFITPRERPINTSPTGSSGLSVNNAGVYRYNWQTDEGWVDTCRELVLTRDDGVQHRAFFRFVEAD